MASYKLYNTLYGEVNDGEGAGPSTDSFIEFAAFFGYELWDGQLRVVDACMRLLNGEGGDLDPIVAVPSGHNVGKTWLCALLIAYLMYKYGRRGEIGCTCMIIAPNARITMTQMYEGVKENVRKLAPYIRVSITDKIIKVGKAKCIPLAVQPGNNASNNNQGWHDGVVAAFMDEAGGMRGSVLRSLRSCASGLRSLLMVLGNPLSGTSAGIDNALNYAVRNAPKWAYVPLSSAEHPNVLFDREIIPHAVSRSFVTAVINNNCERYVRDIEDEADLPTIESLKKGVNITGLLVKNVYDTGKFKAGELIIANEEACRRVFGLIMGSVPKDGILPLHMFDNHDTDTDKFYEAMSEIKPHEIFMGLDPSGQGADKGKLCAMFRDGHETHVAILETMDKDRTNSYVNRAVKHFMLAQEVCNPRIVISSDSTGGYGSGFCDMILGVMAKLVKPTSDQYENINWFTDNHESLDLELIEFMFSEGCKIAKHKKRYLNYTSMVADYMRQSPKTKYYTYGFHDDDVASCQSRLAYVSGRKYRLEPKRVHKAREGKSPDGFDAFLLCHVSEIRGSTAAKQVVKEEEAPKQAEQPKPIKRAVYSRSDDGKKRTKRTRRYKSKRRR